MRVECELPKGKHKTVSAEEDITIEALKRRASKYAGSMVLWKIGDAGEEGPLDDESTVKMCGIKDGDKLRRECVLILLRMDVDICPYAEQAV